MQDELFQDEPQEKKKRKTGRPRTRPLVTRACPVCSATFTKVALLQTCSEKCGRELMKLKSAKRREKTCEYCKRQYRSWRDNQKFCSLHCSVRGRAGTRRYALSYIKCEQCEKKMLVQKSRKSTARYCSRRCHNASATNLPYAQFNRGMHWEEKCAKKLRSEGYLVFRSHLSRGPFDLIAVHPLSATIRFVQVKGTANRKRKDPGAADQRAIILTEIPSVLESTKEIWRIVEGEGIYESIYPNEYDGVEYSEYPVDEEGWPIVN
jgi:hypothetical protein